MIRWPVCPTLLLLTAWLSSCTLSWDGAWPDAGASRDGEAEAGAKLEAGTKPEGPPKTDRDPDGPAIKVDQPRSAPACSKLGVRKGSYRADMVICGVVPNVNQCEAATLCNSAAGWTLCTASQFLARGGKTSFLEPKAWIASCIRIAGVLQAPTQRVCSCVNTPAKSVASSWPCGGGGGLTSVNSEVGVRTFNSCRKIGGINTAGAFWKNLAPEKPLSAALCCN